MQCSVCKVPHHRECWEENGGCTTFGCQGLSDGVYQRGTAGSIGSNKIVIDDLSDGKDLSYESDFKVSKPHTYSKASYGKRIGAYIIDNVIAATPFLIFLLFGYSGMLDAVPSEVHNFFIFLLVLIYGWAIFFILTRDCFFNGQSPGKKMLGLMVVFLNNNQPCTIGLSVKRNILYIFLGLIELIVPLFHNKGHRLGDMIAKTQVIEVNHYRRFNDY